MAVTNETVLRHGIKLGSGVSVNKILDEDDFSSNSDEALATQQSIKALFDTVSSGYGRRKKVITIATSTSAPPTEVSGDRYILDNSGAPHANWDGASQGDIVEFNGTTWDATTPTEGWVAYCDTDNKDALCVDDGTLQWELRNVAITNHNDLSNIDGGTSGEYYHMTNSEHTTLRGGSSDASSLHHHDGRYYTESEVDALLPADGTAAGQLLHWTGSAWDHTETSELVFDDTNKRLGLGIAAPTNKFHIATSSATTADRTMVFDLAYTGVEEPDIYLRKARGSIGSEADVAAGDGMGALVGFGYINSSWSNGSGITMSVADTHTTYVSGELGFYTRDSSNAWAKRMTIASDGKVGIGVSAPTYGLQVESEDTSRSTIATYRYNTSGNGAIFRGYSARGTQGTPAAKQDNDTLANYVFGGYDGNSWEQGAVILARADGNWTDTNLGADITFHMCANGGTTLIERFAMESGGSFYMDQTSAPSTTTDRLYNVSGDLYWDGTQLNGGTTVTAGTAAGQMLFWDGSDSWDPTETSELKWDDTNKRLHVGNTNNSQTYPGNFSVLLNGSVQAMTNDNGVWDTPHFYFLRSRGSLGSEAVPQSGDLIGNLSWSAMWDSGNQITAGRIQVVAQETFASNRAGSDMLFYTAPTGAYGLTERLRIEHDGALKFAQMSAPGTTTDRLYNVSGDLYWDGTKLNDHTDSRLTSGTAAGQFLFWDGSDSWDPTETSELFWDDTNKRLGIGDSGAEEKLSVSSSTAGLANASVQLSAATGYAEFKLKRSAGSVGSESAIQADQTIGVMAFEGHNGTAFNWGAYIYAVATETWSGTQQGTNLGFQTTNEGATTPTRKLRIEPNGELLFTQISAPGTTTDRLYDVGGNLYWDGTQLNSHTDSRLTSGTAAGQMLFWDGSDSWDPTETSELFWDDTNKRIGISEASPSVRLELHGGSTTADSRFAVYRHHTGAGPAIQLLNSLGSQGTPTALDTSDSMGSFEFHGYDSDSYEYGAGIEGVTTQAWTNSARGCEIRFYTTDDDSTTITTRLTVENGGALKLAQTSAPSTTTDRLYNVSGSLYWDGTQLDAGYVDVSGTPVDNQVAIWTDADTIEGDSDFTFDGTNVGIGTDSANYPLEVVSESGAYIGATCYKDSNTEAAFIGRRTRGTEASPTDTAADDKIVDFAGNAWINGGWDRAAEMQFTVNAVHTTYVSGYIHWSTSDTSGTYAERMRLTADGRLGIGTDSPDKGLVLAGDDGTFGIVAIERSETATGGAGIQLKKSRGTSASPTDVAVDDFLGQYAAQGYINSGWDSVGDAAFIVAGSHTTYLSADFVVRLQDSSNSYAERLRVTSEGAIKFQQVSAPSTTTDKLYDVSGDLYWDGTKLNGSPDSRLTSGTAAGQMLFWDGTDSWDPTETSELFWDDTNKRLGIGDTAPYSALELSGDSQLACAITITEASDSEIPFVMFRRSRGTTAARTSSAVDDVLGGLHASAYINSAWDSAATIRMAVEGTHTTYVSSYIAFQTQDSSNSNTERLRIESDGALKFAQMSAPGTTTDRLYNVSGDLYWDGTKLNESLDSRLTSGTAAGQMLFWDGTDSWDPTETSELFWDDTNKRLGVGDTAPYSALEVSGDSQLAASITITEAHATEIPFLFFRKSLGTSASRTDVAADTILGGLHMNGWINSGWDSAGSIRMGVNATHTTYVSSYWAFYTQDTSNSNTERLRIEQDGALKFAQMSAPGTTTDRMYNVGGDLYWDGNKVVEFESAENTDVDTGTENVDTFADTVAEGASWFYKVSNGTNHRGGIVVASWDATNDTVAWTDMSTSDNGDTSQLTFSVDISANTVRLRATATTDNWSVKVERKLVAVA